MTMQATAFTPYDAKGNREDLSDYIYNIDPTETPLMNMAGRGKATNTLHEWQTEALAAASSANQQLDGDLVTTFTAVTASVRVGNYQNISRKLFAVSGSQEAVNHAGRQSELAHVGVNKMAELKRDMEKAAFENLAGAAGSTTVARVTAGLGAWLKTNTSIGTSGGNPTYTSGVPGAVRTDGTQRAFTETISKAVLSSMFTAGAKLDTLFVSAFNKGVHSGFSGIATKTVDLARAGADQRATIAGVDVYWGEFGTLKVIPSRLMRSRDAYYIDRRFISFTYLRPFFVKTPDLAFDGTAKMVLVEWGLKIHNEAAHGIAADLDTA